MPPETESQSGTRTDVLSGTPARVEGVCTQSEDLGNALPSRFRHCAVPRHSHTQSAWSSEFEVCHAAFPAVKNKSDTACVETVNKWKAIVQSLCIYNNGLQSKSWDDNYICSFEINYLLFVRKKWLQIVERTQSHTFSTHQCKKKKKKNLVLFGFHPI